MGVGAAGARDAAGVATNVLTSGQMFDKLAGAALMLKTDAANASGRWNTMKVGFGSGLARAAGPATRTGRATPARDSARVPDGRGVAGRATLI